jgi:protein-S-isoprenylcysteine O-methyltransferase Ste14
MKRLALSAVLWLAALFVSAGRLDWAQGWAAVGLFCATIAVNRVLIVSRNPELLRERWKKRQNTKQFDKVFGAVFVPSVFVVPVMAGLEVRLSDADAPLWLLGAVLVAMADVPIAGAAITNPHLEATVRIQEDRGHRVVSSGPYRFVRHPMYVGLVLQQTGFALLLGSVWASVPVAVIVVALVVRTALEDRTLREELPGYAEYARQTRFRLLPLVW